MSVKRIEQTQPEPTIISRANFDADFRFGFVALEFNPEREIIHRDNRSGREIRTIALADICYRCVRCQFDTLDRGMINKHMDLGNHQWPYGLFNNPYGHIADAYIEGIENYPAFLAEREN